MRRHSLLWLALGVVVAVALVTGTRDDDGPPTTNERVTAIAQTVRCPTCQGLSAAESDARAAQAVRDEIRRRVLDGESAGEIRAYLASRYGRDIVLKPEAGGVAALVWALPVAAMVAAAVALAVAFRRWRPRGAQPTPEDEALVEELLRS